jgi:hypothetical protein
MYMKASEFGNRLRLMLGVHSRCFQGEKVKSGAYFFETRLNNRNNTLKARHTE